MRVLVTGSSGRIGAAVCRALAAQGDPVVGPGRVPGSCTRHPLDLASLPALPAALHPVLAGMLAVVHGAKLQSLGWQHREDWAALLRQGEGWAPAGPANGPVGGFPNA